jgi:DNA-binding response OmpR family regulator
MSPTILIADNDSKSTALYESYLSQCGYRVLTATSAIDCLPIIRDESPAVIVASVHLPWGGVDGLVDCLLDEKGWSSDPIVILTGDLPDEEAASLREMPCVFRYLRKPFLIGRLLDHIRAIEFGLRDARRPFINPRSRMALAMCQ